MVNSTKVVDKLVTYFCLYSVTRKSLDNLAKVNGVDPVLAAKNTFSQIKENAQNLQKLQ
jgi:hypothetical protein